MKKEKKICLIFSTRPEIIKLVPIIRNLQIKKKKFFSINTGQHFNTEMSKIFYKEFKIIDSKYKFIKKKGSEIIFFSDCMKYIEKIFLKEKPSHVIVQGDTNSTLIGALTTYFHNRTLSQNKKIKIIHVEAGLRSFDDRMPEEINRKITDLISDILFTPTSFEKKNLIMENINKKKKINVVGNTITDSLRIILKEKKIDKINKSFFLLTLHRPELVDDLKKYFKLLKNLNEIAKKNKTKILYPIHPRVEKKISKKIRNSLQYIEIIKPIGYLKFIILLKSCKLIFTDSGGIQEEAYILNKPCITLRESTERQVTTFNKANIITGYNTKKINMALKFFKNKKIKNKKIFGEGNVANKIINQLN